MNKENFTVPAYMKDPKKMQKIIAATAVWNTADFNLAVEVLWRWWCQGQLDIEDLEDFARSRKETTVCLTDEEICRRENEALKRLTEDVNETKCSTRE